MQVLTSVEFLWHFQLNIFTWRQSNIRDEERLEQCDMPTTVGRYFADEGGHSDDTVDSLVSKPFVLLCFVLYLVILVVCSVSFFRRPTSIRSSESVVCKGIDRSCLPQWSKASQLPSISTRLPSARKRFYHFRYMCDRINRVSGRHGPAFLATSRGGVIDICRRTSFTACAVWRLWIA